MRCRMLEYLTHAFRLNFDPPRDIFATTGSQSTKPQSRRHARCLDIAR